MKVSPSIIVALGSCLLIFLRCPSGCERSTMFRTRSCSEQDSCSNRMSKLCLTLFLCRKYSLAWTIPIIGVFGEDGSDPLRYIQALMSLTYQDTYIETII